jgi:uncharacterized protein (TIGR03435 family)
MLQSLLEDRFKLKAHRESKEFSVYFLKVTKNRPKLTPVDEPPTPPRIVPGAPLPGSIRQTANEMIATAVPMSFLASTIGQFAGRPVLDDTGLGGKFDFILHWLSPPPIGGQQAAVDDQGRAALFNAVQDLGLKLESSKAQLEVLVIDSVQRPSEN